MREKCKKRMNDITHDNDMESHAQGNFRMKM